MASIRWSLDARADLRQIRTYLERTSPEFSLAFTLRITDAVKDLETYPRMGRIVPEFDIRHIREIILQGYRIIYSVGIRNEISVVAIVRGSVDVRRRVAPRLWDIT